MTREEIQKLKELANNAWPKKWVYDETYKMIDHADDKFRMIPNSEENARFSASANPSAIFSLIEQLEKAEGVIGFYGNGSSWTTHEDENHFNNVVDSDWIKEKELDAFVGGKRAREYLKERGE